MDWLTWFLDWKPLGAVFSALAIYAARRVRPARSDDPSPTLPPISGRTTRFFRWIGEIGASPVTLRVERLVSAAQEAKDKKSIAMLTREIALLRSGPTCSNGSSSDSKATTPATTSDEAKTP